MRGTPALATSNGSITWTGLMSLRKINQPDPEQPHADCGHV
jgi:hypothetical protein